MSILRLGQGNLAGAKSVGSGVAELRLDFGPGYRVYFGRDGERKVVLLIVVSTEAEEDSIRRIISDGPTPLGRSYNQKTGFESNITPAITPSRRTRIRERVNA